MCDFDLAGVVPPEMRKKRRVVVISPGSYNRRHGVNGSEPGRCLIVPVSATEPRILTAADVPLPIGVYRSLTLPPWAICSAMESVSHARLDRVAAGRVFMSEFLTEADMQRLEDGIRHATGLAL